MSAEPKATRLPHAGALTALLLTLAISGCASDRPAKRQPPPLRPVSAELAASSQAPANDLAERHGLAEAERIDWPSDINHTANSAGDAIIVRGRQPLPRSRRVAPSRSGGDGRYTLNFENSPLDEVVDAILGGLLEENYSIDPGVSGSVTLQTTRPVPEADLLPLLESLLGMNGAVLSNSDGLYRVLPADKAASSPMPLAGVRQLAVGGQRLQAIPLNFIDATEMADLLKPIIGPRSVVHVNPTRNFLLITGSAAELAAAQDAVSLFDVNWLKGRSIGIFPLEQAEARTIADELGSILDARQSGDGNSSLRVDTISRLNAVLVIASHPEMLDEAATWIRELDRAGARDGTQLFVYSVKNRRARELADVLGAAFIDSGEQGTQASAGVAPGLQATTLSSDDAGTAKPAAPAVANHGNAQVRVVADEINNTLLIFTTAERYRTLLGALRRLDTVPRQVLIEASIIEVSLSDELSYGLEWFFKNNGIVDGKTGVGMLDLSEGSGFGPQVPGFSYSLVDGSGLIRGVLNMLASDSRLNVISSPSLMVLDNRTANIRVGSQLPVSTGSSTTDGGVVTESIQFKDTGVLLTVTPQVNADGLVTMELSQEVTDVGAIDPATNQRSFLQRNINSTVAIQSGNTIVLGGLITENTAQVETGIPGLHALPLIGPLFGRTEDTTVRRELLVLITPKVVRSHREALEITSEFRDRLTSMQEAMQAPKD